MRTLPLTGVQLGEGIAVVLRLIRGVNEFVADGAHREAKLNDESAAIRRVGDVVVAVTGSLAKLHRGG